MIDKPKIEISRKELFDLAWLVPKNEAAEVLGVTPATFAKKCLKNDVPRPTTGHWRKQLRGQPTVWRELPEQTSDGLVALYTNRSVEEIRSKIEELKRAIPAYEVYERNPKNRIVVPSETSEFHPLVQAAQPHLGAMMGEKSRGPKRASLAVLVSDGSAHRASMIMDTIIKSLAERCIPVKVFEVEDGSYTAAIVDGQRVAFYLHESKEVGERELLPGYMTTAWVPSGRLVLWISNSRENGGVEFRDTECRIEDRLNDFVIAINRQAEQLAQEKLERAERKRQWELDRPRREAEEQENLRQELLQDARRRLLDENLRRWRAANEIRQYALAVQRHYPDLEEPSEKKHMEEWFEWVENEARKIDPFYRTDASPYPWSTPDHLNKKS